MFSFCRSFAELFALKVESCQKSRRNCGRFLPSHILQGEKFQKLYPNYHTCLATRRLIKFREFTPTNSEVIGTHMLNFKPDFLNVRPYNFSREPRPCYGSALANLGQSIARVKI